MNELRLFENPSFGSIRVIEKDGKTWFVAKDIADILEYAETSKMTKRLPEKYKGKASPQMVGAVNPLITEPLTIINEPGFYCAITGSKKAEAEKFQDWVFEEVLPAIRKYGLYATPQTTEAMIANPDEAIKYLKAIKREREARVIAEKKAAEAIRTKAWISDKKTATALQTASAAVRRANNLAEKLGESSRYATCMSVARALKVKELPWLPLKNYCKENNLEIKKANHPTFGPVNSYPAKAWLDVYGINLKKLFGAK